jgi:Ca-activated chloride channel homolog
MKKIASLLLFLFSAWLTPAQAQEFDDSDVRTDVIIAIDISSFMKAEDFEPNRLEAAKAATIAFNEEFPDYRVGVMIVGAEAKTLIPLHLSDTFSNESFNEYVNSIALNSLKGTGTALGEALDLAIKEYQQAGAKEEFLILLSDGGDNEEPDILINAVRLARQMELKVFCVGMGSKGEVPLKDNHNNPIKLENTFEDKFLIKIAELTGGQYYNPQNAEELANIMKEISAIIRK